MVSYIEFSFTKTSIINDLNYIGISYYLFNRFGEITTKKPFKETKKTKQKMKGKKKKENPPSGLTRFINFLFKQTIGLFKADKKNFFIRSRQRITSYI